MLRAINRLARERNELRLVDHQVGARHFGELDRRNVTVISHAAFQARSPNGPPAPRRQTKRGARRRVGVVGLNVTFVFPTVCGGQDTGA